MSDNDQNHNEQPEPSSGSSYTLKLFMAVALSCLSSFQFGYNIGLPNTPKDVYNSQFLFIVLLFLIVILAWINSTLDSNKYESAKDQGDYADNVLYALFTSILAVSGFIGGLSSGFCADMIGRRMALLLNNGFVIFAVLLGSLAKTCSSVIMLIFARFIVGLHCGLSSGLVPLYVTEISPINYRGTNGSVPQLMITFGIFTAMFLGLNYKDNEDASKNWHIFGTEQLWPIIFAMLAIPTIIQLILLPFCPESPKYTLLSKENAEKAETDLKILRQSTNVDDEIKLIKEEAEKMKEVKTLPWADLFRHPLRWPLFICCMLMIAQQMTGINAIMFYSTKIFDEFDKKLAPVLSTFTVGLLNFFVTLVTVFTIEKFGRRLLLIVPYILMATTTGCMCAFVELKREHEWAKTAGIICVAIFVIAFALGPGCVPWFYASETFPQGARGKASSLAAGINWLFTLIVGMSFSYIQKVIEGYVFLIFAACNVASLLFIIFFVPETKNKTTDELMIGFEKGEHVVLARSQSQPEEANLIANEKANEDENVNDKNDNENT